MKLAKKFSKLTSSGDHLEKLRNKYVGPYTILSHDATGNRFFLKDWHSHFLKRSVPTGHLVRYYENQLPFGKYGKSLNKNNESNSNDEGNDEMSSGSDRETDSGEVAKCTWGTPLESYQTCTPLTSTPIKSQIVIMSSHEMPPSSDDSETIDVGIEFPTNAPQNPFHNVNMDDIPIEIVDDLNDTCHDVTVTSVIKGQPVIFSPLNDEERRVKALKFSLVISPTTHHVKYTGVSNSLPHPPCITTRATGNGACLFNSFSLLMCGRDTYSPIIRHIICNYIDDPVKHNLLSAYIPGEFCTGKQYTKSRNMHHFSTWGTELEIIAFAQISGFDVLVYTPQKQYARYSADPVNSIVSEKAFYLSNKSGFHFDPIFDGCNKL